MTIMDISRDDNSYRAMLSEQYADVTSLFKYILDMFATEQDSFHTIKITDITVTERDTEEEKDIGYTIVKTRQNGRTLGLNFESILEHNLLPSFVFPDTMVKNLAFAGISFEHEEYIYPVEVLFNFEKRSEDGYIEKPALIVIRLIEDNCKATLADMYCVIGYLQYIFSAAESAATIDEFVRHPPEE